MHNMHEAFQALARAAGLPDLRTNASGHAELVIEKVLRVYITEVSDSELELSCRLHGFDAKPSKALMREMLAANASQRRGRLAIDPRTGAPMFGRRLDIAVLSGEDLETAFWDFVRDTAAWSTDLGAKVQAAAKTAVSPSLPGPDEIMIRI